MNTDENQEFEMSFDLLQTAVHHNAMAHGWWDEERSDGEFIALAHSELSEALEALRNGNPASRKIPKFSNLTEELADCIIRIMDYAGENALDLSGAILAKHEYNKTRPYKHGKKF